MITARSAKLESDAFSHVHSIRVVLARPFHTSTPVFPSSSFNPSTEIL